MPYGSPDWYAPRPIHSYARPWRRFPCRRRLAPVFSSMAGLSDICSNPTLTGTLQEHGALSGDAADPMGTLQIPVHSSPRVTHPTALTENILVCLSVVRSKGHTDRPIGFYGWGSLWGGEAGRPATANSPAPRPPRGLQTNEAKKTRGSRGHRVYRQR